MIQKEPKVAVVIGGAGLLGQEIVKTLMGSGWIAVTADLEDVLPLQNAIAVDIASPASVDALIETVNRQFGRIDAVVNAAYPRNKNYGRKFEDVTFEDFSENLSMHLGGYFLVSQKFALFYRDHGGGIILNISSVYGVMVPRFELYQDTEMTMPIEYAAIKSALIHLTKYIAKYFKGCNIRANCISPGGIISEQPANFVKKYSEFTINKGMLRSSDITGTIRFLLSDESKFINGQNIVVDDGFTL